MEEIINNDYNVAFDFIANRMLRINEKIVFADKKTIQMLEDDVIMYIVITIDISGTVRKYSKECKPNEKWLQIATM